MESCRDGRICKAMADNKMLIAYRTEHKHYTSSVLTLPDGQEIYLLELPWRDNAIGKSCIPEGEYRVYNDGHGRHKWFRLDDEQVLPRTAIEIHPATFLAHLQGCIAPCMEIKGNERTRSPVAVDSIKACELLKHWYGESDWILKLKS